MLKTWNNYNSSKERKFINIAYKQNIQDLHKYYIDYLKIVKNV